MGRDADPPWAILAAKRNAMAQPRPTCRSGNTAPPPITRNHMERKAIHPLAMETLHGLRKLKPNQPAPKDRDGATARTPLAKNPAPNGQTAPYTAKNSHHDDTYTRPGKQHQPEPAPRPAHQSTYLPTNQFGTASLNARHDDTTKSHSLSLPGKGRQPTTTTMTRKQTRTTATQTETVPPGTLVTIGEQDNAEPTAPPTEERQMAMTQRQNPRASPNNGANNKTTTHTKTGNNSFPSDRLPTTANSLSSRQHRHPTMQVHSKPSSGRRHTRGAKSQGPKPFLHDETSTAITPERRPTNDKKNKTNEEKNHKNNEPKTHPAENHQNKKPEKDTKNTTPKSDHHPEQQPKSHHETDESYDIDMEPTNEDENNPANATNNQDDHHQDHDDNFVPNQNETTDEKTTPNKEPDTIDQGTPSNPYRKQKQSKPHEDENNPANATNNQDDHHQDHDDNFVPNQNETTDEKTTPNKEPDTIDQGTPSNPYRKQKQSKP